VLPGAKFIWLSGLSGFFALRTKQTRQTVVRVTGYGHRKAVSIPHRTSLFYPSSLDRTPDPMLAYALIFA